METPPGWLCRLGLTQELWQQKKVQWLEAVDRLLDVVRYLQSFFDVDTRIAEAEEELRATTVVSEARTPSCKQICSMASA